MLKNKLDGWDAVLNRPMRRWRSLEEWWPVVFAGIALVVLVVFLLGFFGVGDAQWMVFAWNAIWFFGIVGAFLAPSIGASIRKRVDYSPLLEESLVTPGAGSLIPDAMIRRVKRFALYTFVASLVFPVVMICSFFPHLFGGHIDADKLHVLLLNTDFVWLVSSYPFAGHSVGFLMVLLVFMGINYASGIAVRTAILSNVQQHDAKGKIIGGGYTAILVVAAAISFVCRIVIASIVHLEDLSMLLIIVLEGVLAAGRLVFVHVHFEKLRKSFLLETKAMLLREVGE